MTTLSYVANFWQFLWIEKFSHFTVFGIALNFPMMVQKTPPPSESEAIWLSVIAGSLALALTMLGASVAFTAYVQNQKQQFLQEWEQRLVSHPLETNLPAPVQDDARDICAHNLAIEQSEQECLADWQNLQIAQRAIQEGDLLRARQAAESLSFVPYWNAQRHHLLKQIDVDWEHYSDLLRQAQQARANNNLTEAVRIAEQIPDHPPWSGIRSEILSSTD